jgi:hypothetical protein
MTEVYTQTSFELIAVLSREYPTIPYYFLARGVVKLLSLAQRRQDLANILCERSLKPKEQIEFNELLRDRLNAVNKEFFDGLLAIYLTSDPRGATVKLDLPSKTSNSFAGEKFCIPTKEK